MENKKALLDQIRNLQEAISSNGGNLDFIRNAATVMDHRTKTLFGDTDHDDHHDSPIEQDLCKLAEGIQEMRNRYTEIYNNSDYVEILTQARAIQLFESLILHIDKTSNLIQGATNTFNTLVENGDGKLKEVYKNILSKQLGLLECIVHLIQLGYRSTYRRVSNFMSYLAEEFYFIT